MAENKRVYIRTFGCQMNVRDSEVIAGLLKKAGFEIVDAPEKAVVVIFNTCSVRQHAEEKVWSEIGRISKGHKVAKTQGHRLIIGLVGCMAQNYKEAAFERMPAVDFVVGPSDIAKIPEIVGRLVKEIARNDTRSTLFERKIWETEGEARPDEIYHLGSYEDKDHAYVVISEGCSNYCSYCVVPYVRGALRHRSHNNILKEIEEAVAAGKTRVTLLGQNVCAYGKDERGRRKDEGGGIRFVELLSRVNQIKGIKEIGFITSHPKDTSTELFKAMAALEKVKKYLHLPVQSGSDAILNAMNRGYTRKYYLDLIKEYRTIVPEGVLTTDIILGFPGETEKDFLDTFELVKEVRFDAAFIFKYSPRPHSAAQSLVDDVPKSEKERRHGLILELQKKISKEKC